VRAIGRDHLALAEVPEAMLTILYEPSAHLWFVIALFWASALLPRVELVAGRRTGPTVLLILLMLVIGKYMTFMYFEFARSLQYLLYFYVGVSLGRAYGERDDGWPGVQRYGFACLVGLLLLVHLQYFVDAGWIQVPEPFAGLLWGFGVAAALLGTIGFIWICQLIDRARGGKVVRWLKLLGNYSYDIYLWHMMIVWVLTVVLMRRGWSYVPVAIGSIVIATVLPLLWAMLAIDRVRILALLCRGVRPKK
jgi:peptidoglycan/LPS O-acetylase OafA/YrhL